MEKLKALIEIARPFYLNDDPSHDFAHITRVVDNCRQLGQLEKANMDLLLPAALLHDVANVPKNHPDRLKASEMAATKAKELLWETGFAAQEIEDILKIITEHSYSLGKRPSSLESAILQDADKLDALGAIGIMRMTTCGTRMGASYYEMNDPWGKYRPLNDKAYSLDHFFTKLLKLPHLMNTSAGKKEAQARAEFMQFFLSQLKHEITRGNGF